MTKRPGLRHSLYALAFAAALVLPEVARAEEPKVQVMADVVLASNNGDKVDPPSLAEMKAIFAAKNVHWSSWTALSQRKLSLEKKKPVDIPLPNGKKAQVNLQDIKDGVATLRVGVPPSITDLELGQKGKLIVDGGQHQGGQLWLVISSGFDTKPAPKPDEAKPK